MFSVVYWLKFFSGSSKLGVKKGFVDRYDTVSISYR